MTTRFYSYQVKCIDDSHHYVRVKTVNEAQASALVQQNFPDRLSFERVTRVPRMMHQYAIEL